MKIVITGASGFIGRQLVPRLEKAGLQLLLVGRDTSLLDQLFTGLPICSYDEMAQNAVGFDTLLHMAVLNSGAEAGVYEFKAINVDLLRRSLEVAKAAHLERFVNVTTLHAINRTRSNYADSKRAALDVLENETDIGIINVYLPAVYGDDFAGKLALLKKLPSAMRPGFLTVLSALVPTLHIDRLASFVTDEMATAPRDVALANSQDTNTVFGAGKRLIDLSFAAAVIALFSWLLIAVWVCVRLGSPGPGIFAQERVGRGGVPFTCYKFRTMKRGTREAGTHEIEKDAVTGIGAFLRKTKIDELPQVWNIFRGELSLVGPRPCLPVQSELITCREQYGVMSVLPGITGLSQIMGIDMSDPAYLARSDARYIAQRSLLFDLKIILATFLGRGRGDRTR